MALSDPTEPEDELVKCDKCDTRFKRGEAKGDGYPKIDLILDANHPSENEYYCSAECEPSEEEKLRQSKK